jgi:thiol-disulfide isomerase/thioredoxin
MPRPIRPAVTARTLLVAPLAGVALAALLAGSAPASLPSAPTAPIQDAPKKDPRAERAEREAAAAAAKARAKWFERLERDDKAAIEPLVGYAAPEFPEAAERVQMPAATMAELRGKVVVIQTFTSRNAGGFAALKRADEARAKALKPADGKDGASASDVVFFGVHTPDGIDNAKAQLEKRKVEVPVLLDAKGEFCNALGAFRKPIAYVVDRQGNLRYAGLSAEGIEGAVRECAAEPFDPAIEPKKRDEAAFASADVVFPTFNTPVGSALDLRGKPGPEFFVERWYNTNAAPDMTGKLAVVDFWATWCSPCRAAIPHMNELAAAYRDDVVCIGISDESWRNFEEGTMRHRLSKSDFQYPVGIDPSSRMKNAFRISGIPHVAVISADGVVRWQGHPNSLNASVMNQLVSANRQLVAKAMGAAAGRAVKNRWR